MFNVSAGPEITHNCQRVYDICQHGKTGMQNTSLDSQSHASCGIASVIKPMGCMSIRGWKLQKVVQEMDRLFIYIWRFQPLYLVMYVSDTVITLQFLIDIFCYSDTVPKTIGL